MKMMKAGIIALAMCALGAPAQAQMKWTDQAFVNVNVGAQVGSHSLATDTAFEIYEEAGRVATSQSVKGGGLFDVSAGYKVWRNLAAGIGWSRTKSDTSASVNASVPDPAFFDRLRSVTASASGMDHSENAINLSGTWVMPVTDKVDVDFVFGPTIFRVSQDVPSGVTVTEPGPTVSSTTVKTEKKTTTGIHLGFDANYFFKPRIGGGLMLRYSWGSVDLPGAKDNLTVGGFQIGVGARIRFKEF